MFLEEDTGMRALAAACAAGGKTGSPALRRFQDERLVRLAMLTDGLPAVEAACAQAMLEGVRDHPC